MTRGSIVTLFITVSLLTVESTNAQSLPDFLSPEVTPIAA